MFMILRLKEKRHIPTTKRKVEWAKPIRDRKILIDVIAIMMGTRLSNLDTSQPEMGKPASELIGINSRRVPNSASLY